jgi:hypothetical protein
VGLACCTRAASGSHPPGRVPPVCAQLKLRRLALARRRFKWPEALITVAIAGDEQTR